MLGKHLPCQPLSPVVLGLACTLCACTSDGDPTASSNTPRTPGDIAVSVVEHEEPDIPEVGLPPDGRVVPAYTTPKVPGDADDPAIWVHPDDPTQSLIFGTDKVGADDGVPDGGLYVYDLFANELPELHQLGLAGPNNVDVQQGVPIGGEVIDIAVVTEVFAEQLRVYRLPEMEPIDGGGLRVFEGENGRYAQPSGVGIYLREDGATFLHVSRILGPDRDYLHTYQLVDAGGGEVALSFVGSFGKFSGSKDIESVVVDDVLGHVYYCDELEGVRKYWADPDHPDYGSSLAKFTGDDDYVEAREGVTVYARDDGTGYILVSDQLGNEVHVYPREGHDGDPDDHPLLSVFRTLSIETDGMDATAVDFDGTYEDGLFISHSDEGSFNLFSWHDIEVAIRAGAVD